MNTYGILGYHYSIGNDITSKRIYKWVKDGDHILSYNDINKAYEKCIMLFKLNQFSGMMVREIRKIDLNDLI